MLAVGAGGSTLVAISLCVQVLPASQADHADDIVTDHSCVIAMSPMTLMVVIVVLWLSLTLSVVYC